MAIAKFKQIVLICSQTSIILYNQNDFIQTKKTVLVVINIFLLIKHPTCDTEQEVRN